MRHYPLGTKLLSDSNSHTKKIKFGSEKTISLNTILNTPKNKLNKIAIIASGPSLKNIETSLLENHDLAFLNGGINKLNEFKSKQKNLFHFVSDPNFVEANLNLIRQTKSSNITYVYSIRALYELLKLDPLFLNEKIHSFLIYDQIHEPFLKSRSKAPTLKKPNDNFTTSINNNVGFSLDPELGLFSGRTILHICLQTLVFWNYRHIDLFGVDMNSNKRFYENDRSPSYLVDDFENYILPSLKLVSQYAKENNIIIQNHSPESRIPSEVFNKVLKIRAK